MVRMGVRLIQKTDLNNITALPPETSATLENGATSNSTSCDSTPQTPRPFGDSYNTTTSHKAPFTSQLSSNSSVACGGSLKARPERADSFAKLKLSPKAFRFTGKLCRSKSEIEKDSADTSYALNQMEVSVGLMNRRLCIKTTAGSVPKGRFIDFRLLLLSFFISLSTLSLHANYT